MEECELLECKNFVLDKFEFENGEILENVEVEYTSFGTPKYDKEGKIFNAIIYCHGSSGNYASVNKLEVLKEIFSIDEYFFISFSALGTSGSCSPSSTNLNQNFPSYTIKDMVNFEKEFLKAKFDLDKVYCIIGNSLGGFLALTWASSYPDSVEKVISLVSTYKSHGALYASSKFVKDTFESDPNYLTGDRKSLKRTLKLAILSEFTLGFSRQYYDNMTLEEISNSMEEYGEGIVLECDPYDIKFANDAGLKYNIENDLDKITANTLIIAINQDRYFPPEFDAIPMSKLIKNSKLVIYDSLYGHVGSCELEKVEKEIKEFLI